MYYRMWVGDKVVVRVIWNVGGKERERRKNMHFGEPRAVLIVSRTFGRGSHITFVDPANSPMPTCFL